MFYKHIFIYYKNNHKCNIETIVNHKFNNFCRTKMKKKYSFSQKFKRQFNENIYFLIKVIYNIFWIIKKNIKFGNYSFSFKQTFSNLFFLPTIQNTEKSN